jgi:predicted nucleic acid-binding protein
VVLDDLTARRCAREKGIPVERTISLVIQAKHRGIIPAVQPVVDRLRVMGMYLSDRFVEQVRRAAGE